MENTIDNKAKFFAQYWGQKVVPLIGDLVELDGLFVNWGSKDIKCHILLKPLSSITDEDAIEVARLCINEYHPFSIEGIDISKILIIRKTKNDIELEYQFIRNSDYPLYGVNIHFSTGIVNIISCEDDAIKANHLTEGASLFGSQYLQSKGYALPWMGLSVEQLIEFGWIKLKQN